jgi:hypothetical protein
MYTFRLLILGAGFSKPAGMPLGNELFHEVRQYVRDLFGADNRLECDLDYYVQYLYTTEGFSGTANEIDVEKFLSFLDIEHYLELKGSDTWSSEGNRTQLLVRYSIGNILYHRSPSKIPEQYINFASKLNSHDWVLTFNYDTILEQALESIGKPYRLLPLRFSDLEDGILTIDSLGDEVVVLKMHGSIDWFDKCGYFEGSHNPIFAEDSIIESTPIADYPDKENDPLCNIYKVKKPELIYTNPRQNWIYPPLILYPSHTKLLYIKPLIEFWRGWNNGANYNLSLGVVGYSLPVYDDYARQVIYQISKNYQGNEPDFELDGRVKRPVRILDYQCEESKKSSFQKRYQFLEPKRTEYWFDGLSDAAIDWLMS